MARKTRDGFDLPGEFRKLGERLYQGHHEDINTVEALLDHLAEGFSREEATALRAFLEKIVRSASAEEIWRMWNSVVKNYYFYDGEEVRQLLAKVRDKLGQGRMRSGWRPVGEGRNHGRVVQAPGRPKWR